MSEGKKPAYRGFTEAQAKAHKKYIAQFVEVKIRMTPEHRESVRSFAAARGESLNAFINAAIDEKVKREQCED